MNKQKMLTASDQYYMSYVRKTTEGGGTNCLPPPLAELGYKKKRVS